MNHLVIPTKQTLLLSVDLQTWPGFGSLLHPRTSEFPQCLGFSKVGWRISAACHNKLQTLEDQIRQGALHLSRQTAGVLALAKELTA